MKYRIKGKKREERMGKFTYGIIGAGCMGEPLLRSAVRLAGAEKVTFYVRTPEKRKELEKKYNIHASRNNSELAANSDIVLLCVKPQMLSEVLSEVRPAAEKAAAAEMAGGSEAKLFISIAAGKEMKEIREGLGGNAHVIRVMPNLPAMADMGMTCISLPGELDEKDVQVANALELFKGVGEIELIPEKLMNAATCACGSSPAYVFMFIEALADSAVKYGIPRKSAYRLAAAAVMGSAGLMLKTGELPSLLKDKVCSPAGTTIEGVQALEEAGFRAAVMKATDACFAKSVALGESRDGK